MNINMAMQAAMSTPVGTPEYDLACQICMLRGLDPNHYPPRGNGGMNWQTVIAEQILTETLRAAMMSPPSPAPFVRQRNADDMEMPG